MPKITIVSMNCCCGVDTNDKHLKYASHFFTRVYSNGVVARRNVITVTVHKFKRHDNVTL